MIFSSASSSQIDALIRELKPLAEAFFRGLSPSHPDELFERSDHLSPCDPDGEPLVLRLTDGNVSVEADGRALFHYEPGEILALSGLKRFDGLALACDFAVRADAYRLDDLLAAIAAEPARLKIWLAYQETQTALIELILSATLAARHRPGFTMRSYQPGEDIITQGATDTDVYSMVEGTAEVVINTERVGTIGEGEIFGEMSRLTGAPRSATVRAVTPCEVMVFGGEDFSSLAQQNPTALMDIARKLSERLAHLDQKLSQPDSEP